MINLSSASESDLQAELDRRKAPALQKPEPLANPDFSGLVKMMADGIARSIATGYENDDFGGYVYEAAIEAVYGKGYWIWRNAQRW